MGSSSVVEKNFIIKLASHDMLHRSNSRKKRKPTIAEMRRSPQIFGAKYPSIYTHI